MASHGMLIIGLALTFAGSFGCDIEGGGESPTSQTAPETRGTVPSDSSPKIAVSPSGDAATLQVPISGLWHVGDDPPTTYYHIQLDEGGMSGTLIVIVGDIAPRRLGFTVVGANEIRFDDVTAASREWAALDPEARLNTLQLLFPPQALTFRSARSSHGSGPTSSETLLIGGLFSDSGHTVGMTLVVDDQRIALPFRDVMIRGAIRTPESADVVFLEEGGVWGTQNIGFREPVHPLGEIVWMTVLGRSVLLMDGELRDGLISTKQFGKWELLMPLPGRVQAHVAPGQLEKLVGWLLDSRSAQRVSGSTVTGGYSTATENADPAGHYTVDQDVMLRKLVDSGIETLELEDSPDKISRYRALMKEHVGAMTFTLTLHADSTWKAEGDSEGGTWTRQDDAVRLDRLPVYAQGGAVGRGEGSVLPFRDDGLRMNLAGPKMELVLTRRHLKSRTRDVAPVQVGLIGRRGGETRAFATDVIRGGIKMAWIPPTGREGFSMGSAYAEWDHEGKYQHQVVLTSGYWLGVTEVTQAQWRAVMGTTVYETAVEGRLHCEGDAYPMYSVSWEDARLFCRELSARAGLLFSLPTEAQWEYAGCAGSETSFHFGDSDSDLAEYAWYGKGGALFSLSPVGQKKSNAWGLYDVHGNVAEWCSDWYGSDYYRSPFASCDPTGPPSGKARVRRGGSAISPPELCRSRYRGTAGPYARGVMFGLRLCLSAD